MRRILTVFLSLLTLFCASSCALLNPIKKTQTFTVVYDYGFFEEGKAVALLDYNKVFFDAQEKGFAPLLAGDKITVTYTGEMLMQETYPGTVVINGEVKSIAKENVVIMKIVQRNAQWYLCEDGKEILIEPTLSEYVIREDMSFYPIEEARDGVELYMTCKTDENGIKYPIAYAMYEFNPRA